MANTFDMKVTQTSRSNLLVDGWHMFYFAQGSQTLLVMPESYANQVEPENKGGTNPDKDIIDAFVQHDSYADRGWIRFEPKSKSFIVFFSQLKDFRRQWSDTGKGAVSYEFKQALIKIANNPDIANNIDSKVITVPDNPLPQVQVPNDPVSTLDKLKKSSAESWFRTGPSGSRDRDRESDLRPGNQRDPRDPNRTNESEQPGSERPNSERLNPNREDGRP